MGRGERASPMKLSNASLDDVHNELDHVLSQCNGLIPRLLYWTTQKLYKFHKHALLCVLRFLRRRS